MQIQTRAQPRLNLQSFIPSPGHGLSLTNFTLKPTAKTPAKVSLKTDGSSGNVTVEMEVTNTGPMTGDVVLEAFFVPKSGPATEGHNPLRRQLFDYTRINKLAAKAKTTASFTLNVASLAFTEDASGNIVAPAATYDLVFTDGSGQAQGQVVVAAEVTGSTVVLEPFPSPK